MFQLLVPDSLIYFRMGDRLPHLTDHEAHRIIIYIIYCRQRGVVVRSVVFTMTMIARLMVHLPT